MEIIVISDNQLEITINHFYFRKIIVISDKYNMQINSSVRYRMLINFS